LNPDGSPGAISLGASDIAPGDLESLSTRAWTLQESLLSPRVLVLIDANRYHSIVRRIDY
jgi:hypothetical protein